MRILSRTLASLLAVGQGAATPTPGASSSPSPQAPTTACPQASVMLPAPLDRVLRDYEVAWGAGNGKALAALFAEDGFVMSTGNTPACGRAEIERRYATSGGVPLSLRAIAFTVDGSIGFILGCYASRANDADIGKFTLTLKKGKGGRWLIFSDMDNPNRRR